MLKKGLRKPQQRLLDSYFKSLSWKPEDGYFSYDNLPESLVVKLEKIFPSESLWCDSERYLNDLAYKVRNEKLHKELQKLLIKN